MNKTRISRTLIGTALMMSFALAGCGTKQPDQSHGPVGADGIAMHPATMSDAQKLQMESELRGSKPGGSLGAPSPATTPTGSPQ